MKILKGKTLVIPDIHQNVKFAQTILDRWRGEVDHIVFLGDYFDCFETPDNKTYWSMENTCAWLNRTFHMLGDKATWLLGNHDLAYIATLGTRNLRTTYYSCSGWTPEKAQVFNHFIDPEFVKSLELCTMSNSFVLSHAGFHYEHFQPHSSELDNIKRLHQEWEEDKGGFFMKPFHWIWEIGQVRGGIDRVGSPIWLDWNVEFAPMIGVNQIVGHTNSHVFRSRHIEGGSINYCLDAYRTTYSVILESGKVEIYFL